jgi:pimeloyl-ACP methyl ester carboxylesterase
VLFVHGNSSSSASWVDTIEGIKHIPNHIIAVDQRGFGRSSYKTPCNRFKEWAEDLKAFCKLRGIEKCIVNGWSFGGGVAMKFA